MLEVIIWIIGIALVLAILGAVFGNFESSGRDKRSPYHPDNRDKL